MKKLFIPALLLSCVFVGSDVQAKHRRSCRNGQCATNRACTSCNVNKGCATCTATTCKTCTGPVCTTCTDAACIIVAEKTVQNDSEAK